MLFTLWHGLVCHVRRMNFMAVPPLGRDGSLQLTNTDLDGLHLQGALPSEASGDDEAPEEALLRGL